MIKKDSYVNAADEFLTPEEVANILRINVLTVYGYIQKENLVAVRLGRNYRISRQDLASFIKSKRTKSQPIKKSNHQSASHIKPDYAENKVSKT